MQFRLTAVLSIVTFLLLSLIGCENPNEPLQNQSESFTSATTMLAKNNSSNSTRYKNCSHKNKYEHKRDCELRHHDSNCGHTNNDYSNKPCSHKTQSQHDRDCSMGKHDTKCNHDDDDECDCDDDGTVILWADKNTEVGTVTVTRNNNTLVVTYTTNDAWKLRETHLDISTQQYVKRGAPGQYDYNSSNAGGVTSYTYTIPVTWATGTKIYFLAHAVVGKYNSRHFNGTETAFGGTVIDPRNGSWFATFCFEVPAGTVSPQTYSINGTAFVDANSNGVQDSGEIGLADVAVSLNTGATATTNAIGEYSFGNVVAGSYTVTASSVSGYTQTSSSSVGVVLTTANGSANFGYAVIPPALFAISGAVYFDTDGNGVQDSGELGIAGVVVHISTGESIITDANGVYSFAGLSPGTYSVYPDGIEGLNHTSAPTAKTTIGSTDIVASFGYNDTPLPERVVNNQHKRP